MHVFLHSYVKLEQNIDVCTSCYHDFYSGVMRFISLFSIPIFIHVFIKVILIKGDAM